jgi:hypothetical protein
VQASRGRCGLHAVAKTASRVVACGPRASSPVGLLVDHGSVVVAEHFVVVEVLERVEVGERRALVVVDGCVKRSVVSAIGSSSPGHHGGVERRERPGPRGDPPSRLA